MGSSSNFHGEWPPGSCRRYQGSLDLCTGLRRQSCWVISVLFRFLIAASTQILDPVKRVLALGDASLSQPSVGCCSQHPVPSVMSLGCRFWTPVACPQCPSAQQGCLSTAHSQRRSGPFGSFRFATERETQVAYLLASRDGRSSFSAVPVYQSTPAPGILPLCSHFTQLSFPIFYLECV